MTKQYHNYEDLSTFGEIGDFVFFNNYQDIYLIYPIQSTYLDTTITPNQQIPYIIKGIIHLPIHTIDSELNNTKINHPSWLWDGDMQTPTLNPSINVKGQGDGWHGYYHNGKIETI